MSKNVSILCKLCYSHSLVLLSESGPSVTCKGSEGGRIVQLDDLKEAMGGLEDLSLRLRNLVGLRAQGLEEGLAH